MNIKKSKIALALSGLMFLTMPLASTFADQKHNEVQDMQNIKNELRGYVEGVKSDDMQKMQQHVNTLLKLSAMPAMANSKMEHREMQMDHADMTNETMTGMEHSKMDHSEAQMKHADMENDTMVAMDHSKMEHSATQMDHANMDHGDMKMVNTDHDMSTVSGMEGMSAEQHQHMMYMQEMTQLHDLFKSLDKAKDRSEISAILAKIKEQIKNSNE